jgi:RNA polymerase sigma-70 factor (ECF subfamily)
VETRVRAILGERLRRKLDVEDILQETFLRALETMDRFAFRGDDSFFAWLSAIAEYLVLNASQKKSLGQLQLDREVACKASNPSAALRRHERFDRLKASLRILSRDQRRAVVLARLEGLPTREIAARMGRSEQAVRQLLSRALRQMHRTFGDTESFDLPERSLAEEEGEAEGVERGRPDKASKRRNVP